MIYALDIGKQTGLVAFDGRKVHFSRILDEHGLLVMLRASREALRGNLVAIEMIGHYGTGMPAGKDVFDCCILIGRAVEICDQAGAQVQLILRPTIKSFLCGKAKAGDPHVRQALIDRYGEVGTKSKPGPLYGIKSHLWAALAVAHYAANNPPAKSTFWRIIKPSPSLLARPLAALGQGLCTSRAKDQSEPRS